MMKKMNRGMAPVYGSEEWEAVYQEILQRRLREQSPPYVQGTPEWMDAYEKSIQGDAAYREAAADWEGSLVFHFLASPDVGLERDSYMYLDLWHEECRAVRPVPEEVGEAADFILSASYWTWRKANLGELDTNKGILQGKIRLKGDLGSVVRHNQAAARLGILSAKVGGRWLDELDPGEREEIRLLNRELRDRLM